MSTGIVERGLLAITLIVGITSSAHAQHKDVARPASWKDLVFGGRFMDRFERIPLLGPRTSDTWGLDAVTPRDVRVEDGKLHLTTKWDPDFNYSEKTKPEYKHPYGKYTTAAVQSRATFLYGYMEIKCKAADASITSSFWTTGNKTELDIFEFIGDSKRADKDNKFPFAIHDWTRHQGETSVWKDSVKLDWRVADGVHVYGCDWNPRGLRFYADGKLVKAVSREELGKAWILTKPLMLWVDSETFYWEGFPDKDDLPVDFEIEYIRVWRTRRP